MEVFSAIVESMQSICLRFIYDNTRVSACVCVFFCSCVSSEGNICHIFLASTSLALVKGKQREGRSLLVERLLFKN